MDLLIYRSVRLLRVVFLVATLRGEVQRAQKRTQSEFCDHTVCDLGALFEVIAGTCCDFSEK